MWCANACDMVCASWVESGTHSATSHCRVLVGFPGTPGVSTMGQCYIGRARDAFVTVLKEFGTLALEKACAGQEVSGPVFIKHIHDEALMRLRSLSSVDVPNITLPAQAAVGGAGFSRSRCSKIQNNITSIAIGCQVAPCRG